MKSHRLVRLAPRPCQAAAAGALAALFLLRPAAAQEIAVSEGAEPPVAAAPPRAWHLFLPDLYEPGERYACLVLLHDPPLSPSELFAATRPLFHHAGRAGILVAVPAQSAPPPHPRYPLSQAPLERLLDEEAVAPDSLLLVATGAQAVPALNLLLSRPDKIQAACLVEPAPMPIEPSPLWANLASSSLLLAIDSAKPEAAAWADRLRLLAGSSARLRQLQTPPGSEGALAGLAAEIVKFLLAPAAAPGAPESFEFVCWRRADAGCWWIDQLLAGDPAQPLRISAASRPATGITLQTQNVAALRLLPPPAHAQRPTLLTPIDIDGTRIETWHPPAGLLLTQRQGARWTATAQLSAPAADEMSAPPISTRTLTQALYRVAADADLPARSPLTVHVPSALLELLPEATPQAPAAPASNDAWLDLLEGYRLELGANPPVASPDGPAMAQLTVAGSRAGSGAGPTWHAVLQPAGRDPLAPAIKGSGTAGPRVLAAALALAAEAGALPTSLSDSELHRLVPR